MIASMGELVPLESAVVNRIQRLLKARGAWYVKTTGVSKTGCPDIIACYRGRFIALEVKRAKTGYGANKRQIHELQKIHGAGGLTQVVWNEQQVVALLDEVDADAT